MRSVIRVIERAAPSEIYNLSGQSSVGLSFDQPVETMESIVVATHQHPRGDPRHQGARSAFYNAASSEAFGDTAPEGADETTPFRPRSPYAMSKAAAFWAVANYREAYGLFAASGILFNHESPLRPERFVTQKIVKGAARIAQGKWSGPLELGNLDVTRDWGWAEEYVEAIHLIMLQERAGGLRHRDGTRRDAARFHGGGLFRVRPRLERARHACAPISSVRPISPSRSASRHVPRSSSDGARARSCRKSRAGWSKRSFANRSRRNAAKPCAASPASLICAPRPAPTS